MITIPLEEYVVFILLLGGVWSIYFLLKLHYIFAFGLVGKTAISKVKKQKIEKIKAYIFSFLKVLLLLGLISMFVFGSMTLYEGESLKSFVLDLWERIPDGFWFSLLWTLIRIAILIIVMRYILKIIYSYLDKQEEKLILKKRYNIYNVKKVYLRVHNTIKFTVVLGVVYRIVHFFPFLEEVSTVFLLALVVFFISGLGIIFYEIIRMYQRRI